MHPITRFINVFIPGTTDENADPIIQNYDKRRYLFRRYLEGNLGLKEYYDVKTFFGLDYDRPERPAIKFADLPQEIQCLIDWIEPEVLSAIMHGNKDQLEAIRYAQNHQYEKSTP